MLSATAMQLTGWFGCIEQGSRLEGDTIGQSSRGINTFGYCFVKSGTCLSTVVLEKECVHTAKVLKPNVLNRPRK